MDLEHLRFDEWKSQARPHEEKGMWKWEECPLEFGAPFKPGVLRHEHDSPEVDGSVPPSPNTAMTSK